MEINEKTLKRVLKEQRGEYQRYLGVMVEGFESQVKLLAESVLGVQEQLSALRKLVAENTEAIHKLQIEIYAMKEMVVKNSEDAEIIKTDLHIIKDDIKEKVGRDEFRALEKRLILVERRLAHQR